MAAGRIENLDGIRESTGNVSPRGRAREDDIGWSVQSIDRANDSQGWQVDDTNGVRDMVDDPHFLIVFKTNCDRIKPHRHSVDADQVSGTNVEDLQTGIREITNCQFGVIG